MAQVRTELGASGAISLGQTSVRTLAGVPSGAISLNNLRGKSNVLNIEYLIVGGGGGAGSVSPTNRGSGGGGGAGGYISGSMTLGSGTYFFSVGGGGTTEPNVDGYNGVESSAFGITATGGGAGGGGSGNTNGNAGGSGGGSKTYNARPRTGGAGTAGQGNKGGNALGYFHATGGGGAGGAAPDTPTITPNGQYTVGGAGKQWVNGAYYAGGGGAGAVTLASGMAGGIGGGGQGKGTSATAAQPGTANTGGGGGGGYGSILGAGTGGSGVVIVRYAGAQVCSGGNSIYSSGGYTYHVFTSSGNLVK